MIALNLRQVADLLHIHPSRVEQALHRGDFLSRLLTTPGKKREWTFDEVLRLSVFFVLTDQYQMKPKLAGALTIGNCSPDGLRGEFVFAARADELGHWQDAGLLKVAQLAAFITNPLYPSSIVINVNALAAQLRREWPRT